jgi:hypothetical protein
VINIIMWIRDTGCYSSGYGDEVGRLSQVIHDDPYRVILTRGAGQTHNEVHADVFSFPFGNAQGLQVFGGSQMVSFDPPTSVTLEHIICYLSLHSYLLEILL